jgi:UDP-N-acetylglucosamine--N-acetylmuramyl-(pentapeptide) pyrophosphoryl-undecaprenol N-acetylglucosamine transferase
MEGTGWVGPFIDAMEDAYAAADLVVCRSGAATIAELTRLGCASVLMPYPRAAADHQTVNAQTLVQAGAAVMIPDGEVRKRLAPEIGALLDAPERLATMRRASAGLGTADAAATIVRQILRSIE